jgi:hypothetical protein
MVGWVHGYRTHPTKSLFKHDEISFSEMCHVFNIFVFRIDCSLYLKRTFDPELTLQNLQDPSHMSAVLKTFDHNYREINHFFPASNLHLVLNSVTVLHR